MNANIDVPTLQVRPPWPDELPRIKQFLKGQRSPQETLYPAVLVAPAPERIVGAAALGHTTGSSAGRFYSKFRPRIHQSTFCGPLVAYTESKARELGCTELISESDDSPKDERFFSELGFANVKTEELWLLELRKIMARVEKLADRAMKKSGFTVRDPSENDLPAIREMAAYFKFREPGEVRFSAPKERPGSSYERSLCSVVEMDGVIVAAMLVKGSLTLTGHVDMRMVHPQHKKNSGMLNLLLLAHSIAAGISQGYQLTTITVNRSRDKETGNLLRRSGGRLSSSKALWRKSIEASSTS